MKPLHRNFSVQICMEMSCLHHSTPWVGTVVEGQLPKKFFFTLRIEKKCQCAQKSHLSWGEGGDQVPKFFCLELYEMCRYAQKYHLDLQKKSRVWNPVTICTVCICVYPVLQSSLQNNK